MITLNTSPYALKAVEYMSAGWEPFPLPLGAKFPPPKGMTGKERVEEYDEFTATTDWMANDKNIAVRLPSNIVGIDIDGSTGMDFYKETCNRLGSLNIEFAITSRDNPLVEGFTAFFQIPEGREVMLSGIGKNIDLIRSHHRYSVVAPSIHPSGRVYRWIDNEGNSLFDIPNLFDAPDLPEEWVEYMCKPLISEDAKTEPVKDIKKIIDNFEYNIEFTGTACSSMRSFVKKDWIHGASSRHDSTLRKILIVSSMAKSKHKGFDEAIDIVRQRWLSSFSKEEMKTRNVFYEFDSMVAWCLENSKPLRNNCYCGKKKKSYPFF